MCGLAAPIRRGGTVVTLAEIAILAVAGFAAGTVNAVAGGGSFFTFAALVAAGLPTLDANATSAVALTPANLASAAGYRAEIRAHYREMIPFAIIGIVGGVLGAVFLIWLGDSGFRPMVPWLLLLATLLFAFSGRIRELTAPWTEARSVGANTGAGVAAYLLMGVVAVYGGFFGAGMGIMMLAALSILEGADFHKANAIKNLQAFLIQTVSAGLLIVGGLVHWPQALVTMVASVVGGYLGVSVARRVPQNIVRVTVVTVGAVLTLIFFLR